MFRCLLALVNIAGQIAFLSFVTKAGYSLSSPAAVGLWFFIILRVTGVIIGDCYTAFHLLPTEANIDRVLRAQQAQMDGEKRLANTRPCRFRTASSHAYRWANGWAMIFLGYRSRERLIDLVGIVLACVVVALLLLSITMLVRARRRRGPRYQPPKEMSGACCTCAKSRRLKRYQQGWLCATCARHLGAKAA